jgi:hypothetical protein
MAELAALREHSFVDEVFRKAIIVQKSLGDKSLIKVEPNYQRDPDEHEFFLIRVGSCVAELITCCDQLSHIPLYLGNHRQTPSMMRAGINRHAQIVYHIESYIIRTQGLYDRVLKLVDATFHLLNAPRACRADVVLQNLKVKRTKVPAATKRLEKLLSRYSKVRNEVVHHHSVKDDELRRLEMYGLYEQRQRAGILSGHRNISAVKRELTQNILRDKKREFAEFNQELADAIIEVIDSLAPCYKKEDQALRRRLGKSDV